MSSMDGSHAPARKGGEAVAHQGHKKANIANILPVTDAQDFMLATPGIIAGNHNVSFALKDNLQTAFKFVKRLSISIIGSDINADTPFDSKATRWTCFTQSHSQHRGKQAFPEKEQARTQMSVRF